MHAGAEVFHRKINFEKENQNSWIHNKTSVTQKTKENDAFGKTSSKHRPYKSCIWMTLTKTVKIHEFLIKQNVTQKTKENDAFGKTSSKHRHYNRETE